MLKMFKNRKDRFDFNIKRYLKNYFYGWENFKDNILEPISVILLKYVLKKKDEKNLMVNVGGGKFFIKHWRVLDYPSEDYPYPSFYIDYKFDLTSKSPFQFKDDTVKLLYSSHTLEHIPQEYCQHIFNEFYRCLKKGGAVRLSVPDFDMAYDAYRDKDDKFFNQIKSIKINPSRFTLNQKFLRVFATALINTESEEDLEKNYLSMKKEEFANYYTNEISRESNKLHPKFHINWWNFEKAKDMFQKAGFKKIYRSYPQKSKFKEMRLRTGKYGFDRTNIAVSLYIEAIK